MIEQATKFNELKASLFDVTCRINNQDEDIKSIFKHFKEAIRIKLGAQSIVLLFHQALLDQKIIDDEHQDMSFPVHQLSNDHLVEQFEPNHNVLMLQQDAQSEQNLYHIALKLHVNETLKGILLLSFEHNRPYSMELFEKFQSTIEKCFSIIYNQYQKNIIHERTQLLFQLSTILHSVNLTAEVLDNVYKSIRKIYPSLTFQFLMSHECEKVSAPVQLIDYSGKDEDSLGTIAFINNEIQLEDRWQDNEIVIYSPLSGLQGVYGVLKITATNRIKPSKNELEFLRKMTDMIGRAVERTTLYQSSNQLLTDLQFINTASKDLNKNLEKEEISVNIKKHIVTSCNTEEVGIVLFNNDNGQELADYDVLNISSEFFESKLGKRLIQYFYESIHVNTEPVLSGNFKLDFIELPYHSVMMIPMIESDKLLGFIIVLHETPYYFSLDKYKFVQSFVQHASLAISNSLLKEELRRTAVTDYLTKLYLRNYLNEKVEKHRSISDGGAFILFDIDDFKLVNDTYGHTIGDKVLIQIADVIRANIQKDDIAARWGGEEFAVYLPNSDLEHALEIADNIRRETIINTNPQVSLSMGVTTWSVNEDNMEKMFIRADQALYDAKSKGKNCVIYK